MGYYVKPLPQKNSKPQWKIQFISFKTDQTKNSQAKKPKKEWDIPKIRWAELGIRFNMPLNEVRGRIRQLNSQIRIKRHEEHLHQIRLQQEQFDQQVDAFFPEPFKSEFERRFILGCHEKKINRSQRHVHWKAAQRVILHTRADPSDWLDESRQVYHYFWEKGLSLSYLQKIIGVMNLWGYYFCRKMGKPFMPLPYPRGFEKRRLQEAYFKRNATHLRESAPITPKTLEQVRDKINCQNYNWLYLSVWLGLRPIEIDQLKNDQFYKIEQTPDGPHIVWIYQTKLTSRPPWQRWKLIPIIFYEQLECLEIIRSKNFKRPLSKTIKHWFGLETSLYGGRKGFTDLMLDRDQSFFNISQWMGHSSIERTWRHYKNRLVVHF